MFIDANIFIYALGRQSTQCRDLLVRCAREEVFASTTLEVSNEVTHRLIHRAHQIRAAYGLLTTDSLIVAAMREYGLVSLASRDNDFAHLPGLTIYKPTDL